MLLFVIKFFSAGNVSLYFFLHVFDDYMLTAADGNVGVPAEGAVPAGVGTKVHEVGTAGVRGARVSAAERSEQKT